MRPVTILSWLPLVYTQTYGYGMTEPTPNMENPIVEQIPMTFDPPAPEDTATVSTSLDATALFGNRDWSNKNPALGNSEYDRICPGRNGEVETFENGLSVRYHCDTLPASWDNHNWTSGLRSLEQCARLCSNRPNCKSSFWQKDDATCWVSESSTSSGITFNGYVHMIPLSSSQSEECTEVKKKCQIEKESYETQISECNKKVDDLEHELKEYEKGGLNCPLHDRKIINDKEANYRIYCNKADDACDESADLHYKGLPLQTPEGCIQSCTNTPECKRAIWPSALGSNTKGGCWLRPYTEKAGPVPVGTGCKGYSSAHRQ